MDGIHTIHQYNHIYIFYMKTILELTRPMTHFLCPNWWDEQQITCVISVVEHGNPFTEAFDLLGISKAIRITSWCSKRQNIASCWQIWILCSCTSCSLSIEYVVLLLSNMTYFKRRSFIDLVFFVLCFITTFLYEYNPILKLPVTSISNRIRFYTNHQAV